LWEKMGKVRDFAIPNFMSRHRGWGVDFKTIVQRWKKAGKEVPVRKNKKNGLPEKNEERATFP